MGSISSRVRASHLSKDKKNAIVKHSEQKLNQVKQDLNQFQHTVLNQKNGTNEDKNRMFIVTEKAKMQMEREDKPFTKNDWIAVLVAVGEIKLKDMDNIEKIYTVPELMSMVRGNIYDPNRYIHFENNPKGNKPIENEHANTIPRIKNDTNQPLAIKYEERKKKLAITYV
jgi:hypothetical protein